MFHPEGEQKYIIIIQTAAVETHSTTSQYLTDQRCGFIKHKHTNCIDPVWKTQLWTVVLLVDRNRWWFSLSVYRRSVNTPEQNRPISIFLRPKVTNLTDFSLHQPITGQQLYSSCWVHGHNVKNITWCVRWHQTISEMFPPEISVSPEDLIQAGR